MSYLTDRIDILFDYIGKNTDYLARNREVYDIFEGNLKPYVEKIIKESLSENYYNQIKSRVMPINLLPRFVDKIAKVYSEPPIRTSKSGQEFVDYYVEKFDLDCSMASADEFANLFKSYALEPYIDPELNEPCLRVLPSDRFLVWSDNNVDPLKPTVFIKIMGQRMVKTKEGFENRVVYYFYTKDEFLAYDSSKERYIAPGDTSGGKNIYGVIPIFYGNRSKSSILPVQDSDLLSMIKVIPVIMSDMGGAILFQCFSIIYGVDITFENLKIAPNSLWSFKSDKESLKNPIIGTIKPEADIDKVMAFVKETLAIWIESKGIKAGSMGNLTAENLASGIAKIVDEMDTSDLRRKSITSFKKEEAAFFEMLRVMHNVWVKLGLIKGQAQYLKPLSIAVEYDDPQPYMSKTEQLDNLEREWKLGTITFEYMIKQLHPDWSEGQVKELVKLKKASMTVYTEEQDELDEGDDSNTEEPKAEGKTGSSSGSY